MIKLRSLLMEDREVNAEMLSKMFRAAYISIFDVDEVYIDEARNLMTPSFLHTYISVRISMVYKNSRFRMYNKFYHYKFPPDEMDNLTSSEWQDMLQTAERFPHIVTTDSMIKGNDPLMAFIASVYKENLGLEPVIWKRNILDMVNAVKELIDKQGGDDSNEEDPAPVPTVPSKKLVTVETGNPIVKPSALDELKRIGKTARKHAAFFLEEAGLKYPDQFTLKIRPIPGKGYEDSLAVYRVHSILSGRPIFWMNANLPEMIKRWDNPQPVIRVLTINIVHEWWHAITELLRVMKYGQLRKVKTPIPRMYGPKEEDEAVAFVDWAMFGRKNELESYFKLAIKEFNAFSVYD